VSITAQEQLWDLLERVVVEFAGDAVIAVDEEPGAPRTLYVNRPLLNAGDLIEWAHENGIAKTLPAEDIHVTVAFSKEPVVWGDVGNASTKVTVGRTRERGMECLGDKGAVVLRFESAALTRRWQQIVDAGGSWDWPGYKPHVTLTYAVGDIDLDKIEPYTGLLEFGPEIFAEVDEDWADKVKDRMVGDAGWEESAHPRGQPDNKGQFGKGGGSAKAKPTEYKSGKNPKGRTDREQYLAEHKPKGDPIKEAPDLTGGIPYDPARGLEDPIKEAAELNGGVPLDPDADEPPKEGSNAVLPGEGGGGDHLDQLKALEKIASEVLEKATPAQREQHEKHVEKTRKFFSSDEGRAGAVKAIKKFAAKHAVAMANYHLTDAVMLPVVHQVVEQAVSAVGLGAVPGLTLGATAVATYAANHLMHHFNLTLGGAKELLISTARNAIDVLGGVKEVTARIADLDKRGLMGAEDEARDPSVLDALILLLIAAEGLGGDDEQEQEADDTAKDKAGVEVSKDASIDAEEKRPDIRLFKMTPLDGEAFIAVLVTGNDGVQRVVSNRGGKWGDEAKIGVADLAMPEQRLGEWDVEEIGKNDPRMAALR